jgi:hypothetical protein
MLTSFFNGIECSLGLWMVLSIFVGEIYYLRFDAIALQDKNIVGEIRNGLFYTVKVDSIAAVSINFEAPFLQKIVQLHCLTFAMCFLNTEANTAECGCQEGYPELFLTDIVNGAFFYKNGSCEQGSNI